MNEQTTVLGGTTRAPSGDWRHFVAQCLPQLLDRYPCAHPSGHRVCPRHQQPVGVVSTMCKPCFDELYEQLAAEYAGTNA